MHSTVTDAFDALLRAESYERGLPSLELSYVAPGGTRQMKACVKISYEGQYPLAFRSRAVWPAGQNFEAAVRAGILDVVVDRGRAIVGGIFTLDSVKVDEIEATEIAFRLVAQEATRSLINMLKRRSVHNQPSDPSLSSVTSPAKQDPRPR